MIPDSKLKEIARRFTQYQILNPIPWRDVTEAVVNLLLKEAIHHPENVLGDALKKVRNFMSDNFYVLDNFERELVYIPPIPVDGWINLGCLGEDYYTRVSYRYLIGHLEPKDRLQYLSPNYQPERLRLIKEKLDAGVEPMSFTPILVSFTPEDQIFRMTDGINRVKAFVERNIPYINACLNVSWQLLYCDEQRRFPPGVDIIGLIERIHNESREV